MRHLNGILLAAFFAGELSANTLQAESVLSNAVVLQDEKGPHSCGHRSIAAVNHLDGTATIGDAQILLSWSDERESFFGMLKFRTTRHRIEAGDMPITATASLESASLSTNDFTNSARPAAPLRPSDTEGFFIAPATPDEGYAEIALESVEEPMLLYTFRDAAKPGAEIIRFKLSLTDEDKQMLAGCARAVMERARPYIESTSPQ